jgi:HlyD family secretion protein
MAGVARKNRQKQWHSLRFQFGIKHGLAMLLLLPMGCVAAVEGQSNGQQGAPPEEVAAIVDVAEATTAADGALDYTGTTEPVQQVTLRSQTNGQLLSVAVDVGDPVQNGTVLAQIDDDLLQTEVAEAEAELAALQFEVDQARTQVADALARVEQIRAELQQAEIDADRFSQLAEQGAIAPQQAEIAETLRRTTAQELRSAEEQVRTREQAVASAQQRVIAQRAVVQQFQERFSYSTLVAPSNGLVLERLAETGDVIQTGQDVLKIGDFREVLVIVQITDRDRSQVQVGQMVNVTLDAFPDRPLNGRITRISPVADPAGRLIPVEITIPNPDQQIGSGLIARVQFVSLAEQAVSVPQSALEISEAENVVFVVSGDGDTVTVQPREVQVGDRANGQVQIVAGLQPGDTYVIRSNRPLQPGETATRSLISE